MQLPVKQHHATFTTTPCNPSVFATVLGE